MTERLKLSIRSRFICVCWKYIEDTKRKYKINPTEKNINSKITLEKHTK